MNSNVLMQPNLGLTETNQFAVAERLNYLLADEYVLYTKTRNYHWNVTGYHFHNLHLFFESQYRQLDDAVDQVAERVRTLGAYAFGTLEQYCRMTRLTEGFDEVPGSREMLHNLLADHETIIRQLRQDVAATGEVYHDAGTCDMLTGLMERHEKMAWMIRSYLV